MSGLNNRYWRMFDENSNIGEQISARVGGIGSDAGSELKKPLKQLFKEWDKSWQERGLKPKRKKKENL